MALFSFSQNRNYRLNLYDRNKQESSVKCDTLAEAVAKAREALANDILPTSLVKSSRGDAGEEIVWYPDDISVNFSERKVEISRSLEAFAQSNL